MKQKGMTKLAVSFSSLGKSLDLDLLKFWQAVLMSYFNDVMLNISRKDSDFT